MPERLARVAWFLRFLLALLRNDPVAVRALEDARRERRNDATWDTWGNESFEHLEMAA